MSFFLQQRLRSLVVDVASIYYFNDFWVSFMIQFCSRRLAIHDRSTAAMLILILIQINIKKYKNIH